ncbi:unnamed protein product [Mucor hiemalis]
MTDKDLMDILNKCSILKPIHVFKFTKNQTYGHIHFANEADASSFYYLYRNNSHILCRKFKDIFIRPSRTNGVDVIYDTSLCQKRLDQDTLGWCTCSSTVNTAEKHDMNLKSLIQKLKDEIKEDEEKLEAKKRKLKLLQDASKC